MCAVFCEANRGFLLKVGSDGPLESVLETLSSDVAH